MAKHKSSADLIGGTVRRTLLASAALAPAYFISPAAMAQQAVPGPDRTIVDTDGLPGEQVTLDGSASNSPNGPITSYVWTNAQGLQIATGPTPTVRLPDGVNQITLAVSDDSGQSSSFATLSTFAVAAATVADVVTITVQPTQAPVPNAGVSRTIADTDNLPGEPVTLDGSASTDLDGTISSYQWFRNGNTPLGSGPVLTNVQLPDGDSQITLTVRDNVGNTASNTISLTIGAAAPTPTLANETLKPNELSLAKHLDDMCARLSELNATSPGTLTADQLDLLARCNGIIFDPNAGNQAAALEELGAQDINAIRTQALVFSRTQYQGVMDRLLSLRAGDRGVSVAGLNLSIGGKVIPAEQIAKSLQHLLGGGASSDADEPGGLLSSKLGIWLRGNYGMGEKGISPADAGFESDQWGFTGGIDYRFGQSAVAGISLGYGEADLSFKPVGQGNLDATTLNASLYGSAYLGNFYFDGVFNYGDTDYDAKRRILYTEGGATIDRTATGTTSGDALSGGVSVGYDFIFGGFTLSPTVGYFYVDTNIDSFGEQGAGGLNLLYAQQNYESSTGNAGLRLSYAWKVSGAVIVPHFRATYLHEFQDATEIFGVRFADDPFANSANPTPPIIVQTDEPDNSYFQLAAGMSAQFPYDISGYFEYQRLESLQFVDFQDFTIGLRIQHSFR